MDYYKILSDGEYKFFYCDAQNATKEDRLTIAQIIYSVMKGGINRSGYRNGNYSNPKAYIKGFIQRGYIGPVSINSTN